MGPNRQVKSIECALRARWLMALAALLAGASPLSAAGAADAEAPADAAAAADVADAGHTSAGEIIEICVETAVLAGGFTQSECYYVSAAEHGDVSFGDYPGPGRGGINVGPGAAPAAELRPRLPARQSTYIEEDWRHQLPSAAMWAVAFKASGASLRRNTDNRLFLGDNLRHGSPSNGIGALMPDTARVGLPFESVGLRLQIAY